MDGMEKMFNERWFGSMDYLCMVKKVKEVEHEVLMKKRLACYINNKKFLFIVLNVRAS